MSAASRVREVLADHTVCDISFNEGGGATFCDGSSLANGDFASATDARTRHVADRIVPLLVAAWSEGVAAGRRTDVAAETQPVNPFEA